MHRRLADRDIYWVNSRNDTAQDVEATFRLTGKIPVIWHPETGNTEAASYTIANGVTKVQLRLSPSDAVFVIFKDKAAQTSVTLPMSAQKDLMEVGGSWQVSFQKDRGAPATATFTKLASFSENTDSGIKYFSGTAAYIKTITAGKNWFANQQQLWLELGSVKNLAEVIVNGKSLGIVWKQPFQVDVTDVLKPGVNTILVKVTDLWVNCLIGDLQPGVTNKITYTSMAFYQADSPVQPSGLLGPVKVIAMK